MKSTRPRFRRAVVTGGAGSVGSHVCTHLRRSGIAVVSVDNRATDCPGNLAHLADDAGFMSMQHELTGPLEIRGPVDLVLHLASPAPRQNEATPRGGVGGAGGGRAADARATLEGPEGTRSTLALAVEKGARFVIATPATQASEAELQGGEAATTAFQHAYGLGVAIARVFDTYGPRPGPGDRGTVSTLLRQALSGEPVVITGDGSQPWSACHADDIARGLLALAASGESGPVDLGHPDTPSLGELARHVVATSRSRSPIVFDAQTASASCYPDAEATRELLGWYPRISWPEGLRLTIARMRTALRPA